MQKYFTKWKNEVEDEPQVNHLDVRSHGQGRGDVDEHGGEDQHHGKVYCHHCLKKFEVSRLMICIIHTSKKNVLK